MKTIPLTQGKVALVDDEDFDWLSQWNWCACRFPHKRTPDTWYALRREGNSRLPSSRKIYMHRQIAERFCDSSLKKTDHRDGVGLNNQRGNLRTCTHAQNIRNQAKQFGCSSKFKGVCWHKATGMWHACIKLNQKKHSLGYFHDEQEAGNAYDAAARIHFGEFARLNFP